MRINYATGEYIDTRPLVRKRRSKHYYAMWKLKHDLLIFFAGYSIACTVFLFVR